MPDGVRSTLVVRDAQDHDFGSYNCSVANAYGSDAVEIVLKKQSESMRKSEERNEIISSSDPTVI